MVNSTKQATPIAVNLFFWFAIGWNEYLFYPMGLGLHNASAGAIVYDCKFLWYFLWHSTLAVTMLPTHLAHPWVQVRYQSLRRWQLRQF